MGAQLNAFAMIVNWFSQMMNVLHIIVPTNLQCWGRMVEEIVLTVQFVNGGAFVNTVAELHIPAGISVLNNE